MAKELSMLETSPPPGAQVNNLSGGRLEVGG